MAIIDVKVPQLSESVAEATMLQWKKKPGEAVAVDQPGLAPEPPARAFEQVGAEVHADAVIPDAC
jgi:hypothetical protein